MMHYRPSKSLFKSDMNTTIFKPHTVTNMFVLIFSFFSWKHSFFTSFLNFSFDSKTIDYSLNIVVFMSDSNKDFDIIFHHFNNLTKKDQGCSICSK